MSLSLSPTCLLLLTLAACGRGSDPEAKPPEVGDSRVREEAPGEDWEPEIRFYGDLKITVKKRPLHTAKVEERKRKIVESTDKSVRAAMVVYRNGTFLVDFVGEDGVKRRPTWPEPLEATLWVAPKEGAAGRPKPLRVSLDPVEKTRRESDRFAFRFRGQSKALSSGRVRVIVVELPEGAGGGRAVFKLPEDYEPY